ncbi:protein ERGIC-53-like [Thomomys bottae]
MPRGCLPSPLLCLLLLGPAPHATEEPCPLRRRFEYKLSFKGPWLAWPGAEIPFWSYHGDAIMGPEEVRLAPSLSGQSGAVWSRAASPFPAWEVEVKMRITGPGAQGAQGMALWYTRDKGPASAELGEPALGESLGIVLDSTARDAQDRPAIRVLAGGRPSPPGQLGSPRHEDRVLLGSCHRDFRNRPYPFRVRITYWGQRLRVSLSGGLTPRDPDEVCVDLEPLVLAPGGFFGVSAATSTLADNHDVLSFLTFSLHEPGLEAGPQAFPDLEQLRLARQLEEVKAQLALDARDSTAQLDFKAQEEGERLSDLEETLCRQTRILQALGVLSEQMAQAGQHWREQLPPPGQPGPEGGWQASQEPVAFLQDPGHIRTLLSGQQTLLRALQEVRAWQWAVAHLPRLLPPPHHIRDAAARMASDARGIYPPMGTEYHFLELDQILNALQKELRGLVVRGEKKATKVPRPTGWRPTAPACLHPGFFLFFLFLQTVGFFYYVNFRGFSEGSRPPPAQLPEPPRSFFVSWGWRARSHSQAAAPPPYPKAGRADTTGM